MIKSTWRRVFVVMLTVLIGTAALSIAPTGVQAQSNGVTLTIALPSFMSASDAQYQAVMQPFEAAHPGVTIKVVSKDPILPPPAEGLDTYLKDLHDYMTSADVVYVDSNVITPEGTRAGYFLDLASLAAGDKTLNSDDFYPAAWKAFQWDHGQWALPTGSDALVMGYKASAFDAAGVAYPNGKWTLDDLANALRKLSLKDASGAITRAALFAPDRGERGTLLQSLIAGSLFDSTTIPDTLHLDTPAAEKVLDAWQQFQNEGLFNSDMTSAPLVILPTAILSRMPRIANANNEAWAISPLPGGQVGLSVNGFAVSAGTQHPNEAYALAAYATTRPEAMGFNASPARKSVSPTANQAQGPGPGPAASLSPDLQALLNQALANGLNNSDLRYGDYLNLALSKMSSGNTDAHTALQSVEAQAAQDQQTAISDKATTNVVVNTPVPVVAAPGKITLNFGIASFVRPFPNLDQWQKLAQDFAASDPQVGLVNIDTNAPQDFTQSATNYDCFLLPYNAVPGARLSNILNVDPFLDADKTFDKADVVGNVLDQLKQDGKTWALPLMISPEMLSYDSQLFAKANIPEPTNGWTISAFMDALKALRTDPTKPSFNAFAPGGTYLLMLIAANGGLPLDYRTNPPTINFTDPATVQAIQQVLDLAKNGTIKYNALSGTGGIFLRTGPQQAPITTRSLLPLPKGGPVGATTADTYKAALYPSGTQYNAVSYSISTGYISSNAQNPDACYRWLRTISQHPELFDSMPAFRSLIASPATAAGQGADAVAVYQQIDAMLKDSKTIIFPSMFQAGASPAGFLLEHWLYEAFDNYVQNSADLNASLKTAQTYAQAFQQCTATIAPGNATSSPADDTYRKAFLDCAVKADSRLKDFAANAR
ncbi:MAG TPA: extracellular solute-binding protein [Aggregatilineales bacterium]|nr:extracellular solute-binding protein [Aggregatilineales bacterium]